MCKDSENQLVNFNLQELLLIGGFCNSVILGCQTANFRIIWIFIYASES